MLRKTRIFVVIFFIISVLLFGGYTLIRAVTVDRTLPIIEMDSDEVTISVKGGDAAILEGIKASDEKDGDITGNLFVESKSTFIEKGIFNGGLGSITKDFRSMQYFSCPNQFIATGNSNHNNFKYGLTWMQYRPIHETECCIGNLHRYFPNYVARMWMKDRKGQPVAALYGPSSVEYDLGKGITVRIEEKTAYPFEEQVRFEFSFFKNGKPFAKAVDMDFTYRIPGWVKGQEAGFKTVSKQWKTGDSFSVELPMEIEIVDNPVIGTSVQSGPVVYSYAIPANVEEDPAIYDNLAGKVSANPDFKSWSMTPAGKWNYALVKDGLKDLKVESTGAEGFPFDLETVPLKIRVPVVGVKGWTLKENRFTPALPEKFKTEGKVEYIDLVPYGSTTLRLTIFPTTEK